jgi:hypothetical protein
MISTTSSGRALALMLVAGVSLGASLGGWLPARAQSITQSAAPSSLQSPWPKESPWPKAEPETPAAEAADPEDADAADDVMKDIDVNKLDWSQLNVDASTLLDRPDAKSAVKSARPPARTASGDPMSWSANDKANGAASAVSVKQSVSPFLDARIGADMTVARQPTTMSELLAEKSTNGGNAPQSGGTAWAAITAPGAGSIWDKTAVEARVDPGSDQSKLGTTISKSVPFDQRYSLTLQNGYNYIQQGIVPVPGFAARPGHNYETEQSAKLSIGDTGTSLVAGQTLSSNDDKWLRKVGAEQKLFGGVSITGSIGETAQGVTNKSITAGFKQSW